MAARKRTKKKRSPKRSVPRRSKKAKKKVTKKAAPKEKAKNRVTRKAAPKKKAKKKVAPKPAVKRRVTKEKAKKPAKKKSTTRGRGAAIGAAARRLGIQKLHPEQKKIIAHVLGGGDALAVLPTGYGKSACYQAPSMILDRPVVVVSPLLALLQDQHDKLVARGVPVVRVDSTVRGKARTATLERVRSGGSLLVMTTPETLASTEMARALDQSGIALVAIDEAHTASEWGHDFRPAYLRLGAVLKRYGSPPKLALTATATSSVRDDLVKILGLRQPLVLATSPHRANLRFEVIHCSDKARLRALARLVLRSPRPGIIYCSTTKDVDAVHGALQALQVPMRRYHGRMTKTEREQQQGLFMRRGKRIVMVATSAFGLGIDKPDIRTIIHYQAPASLEQYVQEAGRAGRDGKPADCVLLYSSEDRSIHEFLLSQSRVRPDQLRRLTFSLADWAKEQRTPTIVEAAASARIGRRVVAALVAVLEDAGLVRQEAAQRITLLVSGPQLIRLARSLTLRFERLRAHDAERLDAMDAYGTAERCRAQRLQEYFGVAVGAECGVCDVCEDRIERPDAFFKPLERRKGAPRRDKVRRSRGRGKGRRRPRRRQAPSAQTAR